MTAPRAELDSVRVRADLAAPECARFDAVSRTDFAAPEWARLHPVWRADFACLPAPAHCRPRA